MKSVLLLFILMLNNAFSSENLKICLSGKYPSLCKHHLLTNDELIRTKEAERKENLKICLTGKYKSLCKYDLLSTSEKIQVQNAEKSENLRKCLDGRYPSLCNYALLSPAQLSQAKKAESISKLKQSSSRVQSQPTRVIRQVSGCYQTAIQKPTPFLGVDGEIFKLDDGTIWEVQYEYLYLYEYNPLVIICPDKQLLIIDDYKIDVQQIN